MSFRHRLWLGHFEDIPNPRGLVAKQPLDMERVRALLRELGEEDASGRPTLGGYVVELHDGYVRCPWLMPYPVPKAVAFVRRLHAETGCRILESSGSFLSVDELD